MEAQRKDQLHLLEQLDRVWGRLETKVDQMITNLDGKSPHVTKDGIYDDMRLDWWTSGFWPGILWIMYDVTGKEHFRTVAWEWDVRIEMAMLNENNFHHDVGFQFLPTAVAKYKRTGDADARRRGLQAANFLAGRFNIAGNYLRAWNPTPNPHAWNAKNTGWAIIDSTMNLSLLFWAAEEIADPRFKHIAQAHADTVIRYFIREDGSVKHICEFNPETGEYVGCHGGQGFAPDSAWSRGQAWTLNGLANTYRYTGEIRYLRAAQRVANYFIACLPEDNVPHWDFRADHIADEPRDTSAGSCAASGMLEIARHLPLNESRLYRESAFRILDSLTENYATWNDSLQQGILREATGHKPNNQNVNVSLIYGDYFYVEALAKLIGWQQFVF